MKLSKMKTLYREAQKAYYSGTPIMTDRKFDALEDKIKTADPEWVGFKTPGSEPITKKRKTKLSFLMPSLGKAYPHQIDKWLSRRKGPWLVMAKLDGSSVQANYRRGKLVSVITRGNGKIGQDISFLIPWLELPKTVPYEKELGVRFEAIMPISVFEKKYAELAENPRNWVAGLLNRKLAKGQQKALRDINFVALGAYGFRMQRGLKALREWGFRVVPSMTPDSVDGQSLSELCLPRFRDTQDYEMDGLVLCPRNQKMLYEDSDRPKWAIAYKENLEGEEAPLVKVREVIWQISHARRWTPKVEIEPTRLDGATISNVTVHNAKWMLENKIGPGAKIRIVRSGGVIPKVVGVEVPAKTVVLPEGDTEWRGRYLYAASESEETKAKNVTRFLTVCGVEGVRLRTIEKMQVRSVEDIVKFSALPVRDQQLRLRDLGFGPRQSEIIVKQLGALQRGVPLAKVMVGSGVFQMGIGERRLEALGRAFPLGVLLTETRAELRSRVLAVPGFQTKTFKELASGIPAFRALYKKIRKHMAIVVPNTVAEVEAPLEGPYSGLSASWTGYRSKDEEQEWVAQGGTVIKYGAKTQVLFYKEGGRVSSKVEKSKAAGKHVITWAQRHTLVGK